MRYEFDIWKFAHIAHKCWMLGWFRINFMSCSQKCVDFFFCRGERDCVPNRMTLYLAHSISELNLSGMDAHFIYWEWVSYFWYTRNDRNSYGKYTFTIRKQKRSRRKNNNNAMKTKISRKTLLTRDARALKSFFRLLVFYREMLFICSQCLFGFEEIVSVEPRHIMCVWHAPGVSCLFNVCLGYFILYLTLK